MTDTLTICNICGEPTYHKGPDALDYCPEDGIVEGNMHKVMV
jgi:hypothetical protein